jgi:small subunit ribosomal protein S19e
MSVRSVDSQKLIAKVAEELKKIKEISPPNWAAFVKTGVAKERPPQQPDWWWIRTASILRKLYFKPFGVNRLRKIYSSRANRGHAPEHRYPAGGAIIRKALQQLESAGFVKREKGGRTLTAKGRAFLSEIAKGIK